MNNQTIRPFGTVICGLTVLAWSGSSLASSVDLKDLREQIEAGNTDAPIATLVSTLSENPAHEPARILLAEAYEKADQLDKALEVWEQVKVLTSNEENMREARRAVSRIRRQQLDAADVHKLESDRPTEDPFQIEMPPINWDGLEVVEDSNYLPPILPPPFSFEVPPFVHESQHFSVYSSNERLSQVIAERAELYLNFMLEKLFGGRSWAVRFPILVYKDLQDYQQHGGPEGSGGVTFGHVTGKTQAIIIFQLRPSFGNQSSSRGGSSRGGEVWKYGVESVLPH